MTIKRALMMTVLLSSSTASWGRDIGSPSDVAAVKSVLANYQRAIENLDVRGTERLFAADSAIFETGGAEGSYADYLKHHLQPELGEFKSFKFSNYSVSVRVEGAIALTIETYHYRIDPKAGNPVEMQGVATSALKRVGGSWRIVSMHNSGRRIKGKT